MPPPTFLLMIVQRTRLAAFRTAPRRVRAMFQRHANVPLFQRQLHVGHEPRRHNPQKLLEHLTVLHETPPDVPAYRLAAIDSRGYSDPRREKRSRALLRSNSTKDIPVRGASKRRPRLRFLHRGTLNISAMPQKTFFQITDSSNQQLETQKNHFEVCWKEEGLGPFGPRPGGIIFPP